MRRHQRDRGSMSVEMTALVYPVTVVMLLLLVACWQLATSRHDLHTAAGSAARAASLQPNPEAAATAAQQAAQAALASAGHACTDLDVHLDDTGFARGGQVRVRLQCQVATGDLAGLPVPGSVPMSATARAPVDTFIELDNPPPPGGTP